MEKNKYHILVVDDDDKIRNLVKQFLIEKGYIVSSANNSEDTGSTGGGQSHENRPPFYALCYIMKT